MARSRNIKPGLFNNEELAECSIWARWIFPGLWTIADREGKLEDRPKRIKASLLPFDVQAVEPLLVELERHKFIRRYAVNGQKYILILNFSKHQNPHFRENKSVIPDPESLGLEPDSIEQKPEALPASVSTESPRLLPHEVHLQSGFSPADSLIPDSLISDSLQHTSPNSRKKPKPHLNGAFLDFWQRYPRKEAKADAEKAWIKLGPDEPLQALILKAVDHAKDSAAWKEEAGKFIPYPATWLNGKRWTDEGIKKPTLRELMEERPASPPTGQDDDIPF